MWRQKYKTLLNSSKSCQASHQRNAITVTEDRIWLTSHEINDAINKLKKDKSPGRDKITGEHIQYSHPKLSIMLMLMFNSMIQHGYVPEAFMDTLILSIVKDIKEDLGDSDNYRPIVLTSVISKVFELVILERCRYLTTSIWFQSKTWNRTQHICTKAGHRVLYYKLKQCVPVLHRPI